MPKSPIGPCVHVTWAVGNEYVPLHPNHGFQEPFHTVLCRPHRPGNDKWVRYCPRVETRRRDRTIEHRLYYDSDDHPHLAGDDVAIWGTSTIVIEQNTRTVSARWKGSVSSESDGSAKAILVDQIERVRGIARPTKRNQSQLRKLLLDTDKECAITKESSCAALEVAHIVAVGDEGFEADSNAILLRADLHCLYDAGLFRIDKEGSVVDVSTELSIYYRKILENKQLHRDLTRRIAKALLARGTTRIGSGS